MGENEIMNKIKALREAKGWSMETLAQACDPPVTASQINKVEKGETRLHEGWLRRLSRALDCTMADILGEASPPARGVGAMAPGGEISELSLLAGKAFAQVYEALETHGLTLSPDDMQDAVADQFRILYRIKYTNGLKDEALDAAAQAAGENVIAAKFG